MIQLTLEGVTRRFAGKSLPVLDHIDLAVESGSFVSLVGPSGAGKTTLLRIVAGLDHGFAGRLAWAGGARPRIGMVFQEARLVPWLSLIDNLLLVAGQDARARAMALLDEVELAGSESALPTQLSGGMRRRAALARALLARPEVLLLDEPLTSLDRACAARIRARLQAHWSTDRPTVVLVTHDLAEAAELSTRIVALAPDSGHIVLDRRIALPYPRDPDDPAVATLLDDLRDLAQDWPPQAGDGAARDTREPAARGPYFTGTGAFKSVG